MTAQPSQSYKKHRRWVIGYHFVAFHLLLLNAIYAIYLAFVDTTVATLIGVGTAVALVLLFYYARSFALGDQDRLIRLEERLRLARLLPEDLKPKIELLSTKQLVAMRFASDGELASLTRQILENDVTKPDEIKKLIKTWRPDNQRI